MATTKTYIYTEKKNDINRNGGRNVTADIYEVKKNKPIYVDDVKWNTASFKGEDSSVYDKLKEKKLVSDKEYKSNDGYYRRNNSKVNTVRI